MMDSKKFMKAKFSPRVGEIAVPDLKEFFKKDEELVIKVRGLTANELAKCDAAVRNNRDLADLAEKFAGGNTNDLAEALKGRLGLDTDLESEYIKRHQYLVIGSVNPEFDDEMAAKFAEVYPVEFFSATKKIVELTGLGQEMGKPTPSGKTKESKQL